ncbi:MAG: YggS family pyridoxal phosphate-dependent enzyme [Dehalococcoidia bacterium]|nr:YggS family pyridoxal phosphate-dependent enzyme [Dehalococcoidia bacterium]
MEHRIEILRGRIEKACLRSRRDIAGIKLIAVTKNFTSGSVRAAFNCGLRDFGENRVQEAVAKYSELADVRRQIMLHFIGHLQSNKVGDTLQAVDIIHSIDTLRLAEFINNRTDRPVNVLLEVNLSGEKTKYGFSRGELKLAIDWISAMPNMNVLGLMTIAPVCNNAEEVRPLFAEMKRLNSDFGLTELSMGMTDDFEVAVEEGATMIRIGRAIFGERS